MTIAKEELVDKIEAAREKLNRSIDGREEYGKIYNYSIELDELVNQYMVAVK